LQIGITIHILFACCKDLIGNTYLFVGVLPDIAELLIKK